MNKKILTSTLLSIFLTAGCTVDKIEQPIVGDQPTDESFQNTLPEVLYASISDDEYLEEAEPDTRTYVQDKRKVLWHNGDEISYFAEGVHNVKYQFNGNDGSSSAEFTKISGTGSIGSDVTHTHAIYPYYKDAVYTRSGDTETITVFYPSVQPMAALSCTPVTPPDNQLRYISVPEGTADTYKRTDNWKDWVKYNGKDIYHEYK